MLLTNKEVSAQFSEGKFSLCYPFFADDVQWNIVGDNIVKGKDNVIAHCDKMMTEMTTATLQNTNIVDGNVTVAIEGICRYTNATNEPAEVAYCDVFSFREDKITSITSYCIERKL